MNAPERLPMLGLHRDMPSDDYHATDALGASGLKLLRRSPAHFYGAMIDPQRPKSEPTAAMRNGTLVHCALFEPDALADRYIVLPAGIDGRTKEGKAALAELAASGREVIDAEAMAAAQRQAAAMRKLPEVAALLADGYAEASAFWVDPETGVLCKCRPDFTSPTGGGVILTDGKTCQDASPAGFQRAVINFDYDLGAAFYIDGFERATGLKVHGYVFACVENSWPHAAAAYMLSDQWIEAAREKYRELLVTYARCRQSGEWPGYPASIELLEAPPWHR